MVAPSGVAAGVRDGAHGWNADQFGRQLRLPPVRRHLGGAWNGVGAGNRFVGTLLGPEGADSPGNRVDVTLSGPVCISYHQLSCGAGWVWRGRVTGVWSYVENCTV